MLRTKRTRHNRGLVYGFLTNLTFFFYNSAHVFHNIFFFSNSANKRFLWLNCEQQLKCLNARLYCTQRMGGRRGGRADLSNGRASGKR